MQRGDSQPRPKPLHGRAITLRQPLGWCLEGGLDAAALLFLPILVLAPRGIAALAAIAGAIAAGLVAVHRPLRPGTLAPLIAPGLLLAALLGWGLLSAMWSVDALRSVKLDARLAGMFAAALALAAACRLVAAPWRLTLFFLAGLLLGLVLAGIELATDGALTAPFFTRGFLTTRLNQASVAMTILLLPASAMLFQRGRPVLALLLAAAIAAMVYALVGSAAKLVLAASLPMAALLYRAPDAVPRGAAVLSVLVILGAPASFPRLGRVPIIIEMANAANGHIRDSASHRLLIWSFAGDRIAERPLAGWGLDAARAIPGGHDRIRPTQSWMPLHPHNAPLQVWLELGVPGAAGFALLTALLWLRLAAAAWPRFYGAAAGGSLLVVLLASLGTYGIWQEWWLGTLIFALFLTLVMARVAQPAAVTEPKAPLARVRAAD